MASDCAEAQNVDDSFQGGAPDLYGDLDADRKRQVKT